MSSGAIASPTARQSSRIGLGAPALGPRPATQHSAECRHWPLVLEESKVLRVVEDDREGVQVLPTGLGLPSLAFDDGSPPFAQQREPSLCQPPGKDPPRNLPIGDLASPGSDSLQSCVLPPTKRTSSSAPFWATEVGEF